MRKKVFSVAALVAARLYLAPTALAVTEDQPNGCFFKTSLSYAGPGAVAMSLGCLAQIIINIIDLALSFLGAVALLFLIFGAIKFVISRGDPKALEEAQKTMTYAVLGVVIVLGSFILINIVSTALGYPNILTQFTLFLSGEKVATWVGP